MKRIIVVSFIAFLSFEAAAQVPYFARTIGDGKLYGYNSLKVRPGSNAQETYTCFQYGMGNNLALGTDLYTCIGSAHWSFLVRYGAKISPWFGIGGQVSPSFNLEDNFNYGYTTGAVYMDGQISNDGKLFWCSNTWFGINSFKDSTENTYTNWEYLGYTLSLKNGHSITPMLGAIHSWRFDENVDMAAGLYYSIKNWNIYLWVNDFFNRNPRLVVGIDFAL